MNIQSLGRSIDTTSCHIASVPERRPVAGDSSATVGIVVLYVVYYALVVVNYVVGGVITSAPPLSHLIYHRYHAVKVFQYHAVW